MRDIGEKRHNLTFVKRLSQGKRGNPGEILCICDCGKETVIKINKFGVTKSCGCLKNRKGKDSHSFKGYEEIYGRQWWNIQKNAETRNLEFEITIEQAWNLYVKQKRLCKLSGLPINFGDRRWTASLDRINSGKGYTLDNVQWVHKDINKIKMDLETDRFIELCNAVTRTHFDQNV